MSSWFVVSKEIMFAASHGPEIYESNCPENGRKTTTSIQLSKDWLFVKSLEYNRDD